MSRDGLWIILFGWCVLSLASGYPRFQQQIPNGEIVPHPCKPNYIWKGVGHENRLGGGARNAFGRDFEANGLVWSRDLCMKDSDGDGKTNGEELGDPDCVWTPGSTPSQTLRLSHPGICDPFDSPLCNGKPDFVNCETEDLVCPAMGEKETINITIAWPETPVPPQVTTYRCFNYEFPVDGDYHIVATTPNIDNHDVMHHIGAYGCSSRPRHKLGELFQCGMGPEANCRETIGIWTVGIAGSCVHPEAGFRIGGTKGYRYGSFQIHWNNPLLDRNYTDASGLTFHLTPKLRPHDAGVLVIGQDFFAIPPQETRHVETGKCSESCTRKIIQREIKITSVLNHMHYLGTAQETEIVRDGRHVTYIGLDKTYNYDSPVMYDHKDAVTVYPGDEMKTTCVFRSTSRSATTFKGDETSDEMCFSILTYYPKENLKDSNCVQWKSLDFCEFTTGTAYGCDFVTYTNFSSPQSLEVRKQVSQKCRPNICLQECKAYIRELKTNPCFSGEMNEFIRNLFLNLLTGDVYLKEVLLYTKMDSCDMDLAKEMSLPTGTSGSLRAWQLPLCLMSIILILMHHEML